MVKFDNNLNVGSPYVILTTDSLLAQGIGDIEDSKSVLLTLQEGNLLSFSEKKITGEGQTSNTPTIFLKFLDPEMVFVPRLFDQSVISLYRTYFEKVRAAVGGTKEIKAAKEETDEERRERQLEEIYYSQPETASDVIYEFFKPKNSDGNRPWPFKKEAKDRTAKKIMKEIDDKFDNTETHEFYLKYGNGTGKSATWRKFILSSFFITQDSSNNMVVDITAAEVRLENAVSTGAMSDLEVDNYFSSTWRDSLKFDAGDLIGPPILTVKETKMNKPSRSRVMWDPDLAPNTGSFLIKVPHYGEDLIVTLLENLYQKFLVKHGPDDVYPFVFLSPKLTSLFRKEIDRVIEKKGNKQYDPTLPELQRFVVLKAILALFNIIVKQGDTNPQTEEVTYFITMADPQKAKKKTSISYEGVIMDSMRNMYRYFGLSEGGYPLDNVDTAPLIITNDIHKILFLDQLCGKENTRREEKPKNSDGGYYRNWYTTKESERTITQSYWTGVKSHFSPEWETYNFTIRKNTLGKKIIKVYTDYIIGNGLITPFSPSYSKHIMRIYTKQIQIPFKNSSKQVWHTNASKFLFKQDIRDYIDNVAKLYEINSIEKTTFDYSTESSVLKTLESIPTFIANNKNSNVIEVISTEKGTGFANLLESFSIIKEHAKDSLSDILYEKSTPISFSDEEFDKNIDYMLEKAYKNNAATHTVLLTLGELSENNNIDKDVRDFYEAIKLKTKEIIESSHQVTDREISYAGMTAHLNYIQSLSNTVAMASLKTIPFFNLVDPIILGKPCIFLNNTNFFALTRGIPPKGFLSGIYMISGYEHVISNGDCYSKFTVQRQQIATEAAKSIGTGDPN